MGGPAQLGQGRALSGYFFFAAHGLAAQGFFAAQGFLAAHGWAAQGCFAAHGCFAAQGLAAHGFFAAQGCLAAHGWAAQGCLAAHGCFAAQGCLACDAASTSRTPTALPKTMKKLRRATTARIRRHMDFTSPRALRRQGGLALPFNSRRIEDYSATDEVL